MALSTIGTNSVADSAVTSAKISNGTIATGDIADDAITGAKVADLDALTVSGDLTVQGTTTASGTTVGFVTFDKLLLNATDGSATDAGDNLVLNGTDGTSANADSSVLFEDATGDPNFVGSAGQVLKQVIVEISGNSSRGSASSFANDLDFGSFVPSTTNSTIFIQGVANLDSASNKYLYYRWVINGTNYFSTIGTTPTKTHSFYSSTSLNDTGFLPSVIMTSVSNTDGSPVTVVCQGSTSGTSTLYVNRSAAGSATGSPSSVIFTEVSNAIQRNPIGRGS